MVGDAVEQRAGEALAGEDRGPFLEGQVRGDDGGAVFVDAYWRSVWGAHMSGYELVRDLLREKPRHFAFLDAAQLVKHAFGLRSEVHGPGAHCGLTPFLFYVYAEPQSWPGTGGGVDTAAIDGHREEIESFVRLVRGDEVTLVSCTYQRLLEAWLGDHDEEIGAHARAVTARISP